VAGANLGTITAALLRLLDRHGAAELQAATSAISEPIFRPSMPHHMSLLRNVANQENQSLGESVAAPRLG